MRMWRLPVWHRWTRDILHLRSVSRPSPGSLEHPWLGLLMQSPDLLFQLPRVRCAVICLVIKSPRFWCCWVSIVCMRPS
jgi:hypothetical protein